jgi:hypothetical protein
MSRHQNRLVSFLAVATIAIWWPRRGGLSGTLRPQSNGTYELERRTKIGECRIASDDGSRKTWGIYAYDGVTLRVQRVRSRDGVALQLTGRKTYYESAPSDEFDLCDVAENRSTTRVTLRRTGG